MAMMWLSQPGSLGFEAAKPRPKSESQGSKPNAADKFRVLEFRGSLISQAKDYVHEWDCEDFSRAFSEEPCV